MIVRIPVPHPLWRKVLSALTPVMRDHGLRQKDISSIERVVDEEAKDAPALLAKLESAFAGGPELSDFWLYEWRNGDFVPVRNALKVASR
jgi:hypothetical protein